jgi:hypothetical protein
VATHQRSVIRLWHPKTLVGTTVNAYPNGDVMSYNGKVAPEIKLDTKKAGVDVRKNAQPTPRREFLRQLGGAAAATVAVGSIGVAPLVATAGESSTPVSKMAKGRMQDCYDIRMDAARETGKIAMPAQITNGDEQRYPNFIGNYSKGLPHNAVGEVDPDAYRLLIAAGESGTSAAYEKVPLGGMYPLVNPLAGLAFDLEGADSHQLAIDPPPQVASQLRANEMIELYWMALCRDVHFTDYATNATVKAATSELSKLSAFFGPKSSGTVTAQTLFRGFTADDVRGLMTHIQIFIAA